ncbi:hypothetical protein V2G26_006272 [Clonostachys chloroleuca]|uniref:DUF427 domain-containing protein n=1 Tax=Clonostachys chloroleuca TaxID=1926264 RepID=A0AA35M485_9HYPO|nr:unnamed protein product [Clonostachys chloroleuca]
MAKVGASGTDLAELAEQLVKNGTRKVLGTSRRVRVVFNRKIIVDTTAATLVWEHDYFPQYYVPLKDLQGDLKETQKIQIDGQTKASVATLTVTAGEGETDTATTDRVVCFEGIGSLDSATQMVRLEFGSMDEWLEEDQPIYVHAKDPFKRIDILPSQRPIEVKVSGQTVAKSNFAMHLFETGLPTRYYLPLSAVDQTVLRKSQLVTKCPYKGEAEYYHIVINGKEQQNLVWYYRLPTHESAAVAGMVCFYNEKVDISLDGKPLERPKTIFG